MTPTESKDRYIVAATKVVASLARINFLLAAKYPSGFPTEVKK